MNWRKLNVRITSDGFDDRISPIIVITIGTVGSISGVFLIIYTGAHNKDWRSIAIMIVSALIGAAVVRWRKRNHHS